MAKLKIGVLFGGRSSEHEVSLMSAKSVINALDPQKYDIIPIGITKQGKWTVAHESLAMIKAGQLPNLLIEDKTKHVQSDIEQYITTCLAESGKPDVIFPVLHGPYGEDGTVQGFFELVDIAYVGAGVLGSAVSMDKAMMRVVFKQAGLPVVKWESVIRSKWEEQPQELIKSIEANIGYPCFVKPANLGSSVGITKATTRKELIKAVDTACEFDRRIVVEQALNKPREFECSVLGNDRPQVSLPGEVIPGNEFYDYEDKYYSNQSKLIIPADLSEEMIAIIQSHAIKAFKAVDCAGMARVDFFLTKKDEIIINEINTIPGFTHISMYPKLWEASGIGFAQLVDKLIELAIERHQDRKRRRTSV